MRLEAIRLHWVQIPFHEPFRISSGEVAVKDAILVELAAQGGMAGWGEASPMAGSFYSPETPESTWRFLRERLIPYFLGRPEFDPQRLVEPLEGFPGEPFAKAGLEGAVWELKAKKEAKPLWDLLGGRKRPVPSGAPLRLIPRVPMLLDRVGRFFWGGYPRIKLGSARILNIKVQRMGGLGPARRASDAAQAAGIPCWLGTMPELGIASAQGLHLATLPNFTYPSDVEASGRWYVSDIIAPPLEVTTDGTIDLPDGPGMGFCVDLDQVARYRVRYEEFRP